MDTTVPESIPVSTPSSGLKFSLRSMLIGMGVLCLLLAPGHWFGGVYFFSAACSVGLILLCTAAYRATPAMVFLPAGAAVIIGFPLAIALLIFFFHALANGVACLVLVLIRPRPRYFAIALAVVMAAVYGLAFSQGAAKLSELRELRVQYPLESLSPRLTFEKMTEPQGASSADVITFSSAVSTNLQNQDSTRSQRRHYFSRAEALRELHEDSSAEFARAAGFGFMRMDSLTYRVAYFEQPKPLKLPQPLGIAQPQPSTADLDKVHRVAANDFLLAERMGYIKSRDAVAGFDAHQFNQLDQEWCQSFQGARQWQVVRLELVGLLRGQPRVYVSESLPPMDKIADVPHRPLNAFEDNALTQLATQEDLVVDQDGDRIEMLGALRASTSCLQCHEGASGKLLGAFSYELVPLVASDDEKDSAGN